MELILKENVNKQRLSALIASSFINEDEKKQLKKYRKKINKEDSSVTVVYTNRMGMGENMPRARCLIRTSGKRFGSLFAMIRKRILIW